MIWYQLAPILVLFWIVTAIVEAVKLAFAERGDHLPASPMLPYFWRWFRNALWLTVVAVAATAYFSEKLISTVTFALAVGGTSVIVVLVDRLVQRLHHLPPDEDGAHSPAG